MSGFVLNVDDFVRITNTSSETIVGRYDGEDYTFPAPTSDVDGQSQEFFPVDVNKVVAQHVFGWTDPKKTYAQKDLNEIRERAFLRLGWVKQNDPNALVDAYRRLQFVKIEPVPPFPNVRIIQPRHEYEMPKLETAQPGGSGQAVGPGGGATAPAQSVKAAVKK
jgi:hypothetical protein